MLQLRSTLAPRRALAAAALLVTAVACGGSDGSTSPKPAATTVAVTVPAQINVASNAGALSVQVVATYDLASGASAPLATQTVAVSAPGAQNLPFTLDLKSCLNDAARAGGTASTTCAVRLQLTLLVAGAPADAQSVGAFTLSGGTPFTVGQTVSFSQVAKVTVAPTTGTSARVALGGSLPLTAQVLDAGGNALAGRAVRWSSSAPSVATVDSLTGTVTPVALGATTVTAAVGGQTGALGVTVYMPNTVTVSVAGGSGSGTVSSAPAGIGCRVAAGAASGACGASFASDSVVTLTAAPDAGTGFGGWGGDCSSAGTNPVCTVTPNAAKTATVKFLSAHDRASTLALTLTDANGSGGGSATVTGTGGAVSGAACTVAQGQGPVTCNYAVDYGTTVTVTATPVNAASQAVTFSGACTGGGACTIANVTANQTVGVTFAPGVQVTLNTAGAGGGYVTSSPAGTAGALGCHRIGGVTLGATCATSYAAGAQVTLTATPDSLSTFAGWSGACASSGTTCVFTLGSAAAAPVATFAASASANGVSVAPTGAGTGQLTITTTLTSAACDRNQVNLASGGTCIAPWKPANVPATIVIRAYPLNGSTFAGWTGCPSITGTTCNVPRNGVYAVSAAFTP
ncbi:hypothetical protein tb265_44750 [Gemmatimonadetes bacterium T265]|nr:hypothetical protein tb265_44750 [Gemmatimonadetes bacterium T265]